MKRVIKDYKKLNKEISNKLIDQYPDGYGDDDIITLQKPSGDIIEAVEVRSEDTIYLVKISKSLSKFIANFEEHMEKELSIKREDETLEISDIQDTKSDNNFEHPNGEEF